MDADRLKSIAIPHLKRWWCSLLLLPFILYFIHQLYWVLNFNIFFAISYDFPFPVDAVYFLLRNFALIVHEAGHTFFSLFGARYLTILGGSLFEVILPAMILAYTWYNEQKTGTQFALFYLGFSFIDVAIYAADAGARQLPLIGGLSKESHDWYNLLSGINALEADMMAGIVISSMGILCYAAALLLPLYFKKYETADIELNL